MHILIFLFRICLAAKNFAPFSQKKKYKTIKRKFSN